MIHSTTILRVAAVNYTPFVVTKNNIVTGGVDYNILITAAKQLNFGFTIDLFQLWDDAKAAVIEGKYDLSIGSHWLLAANSSIQFSISYAQACQTLLVNKPRLLPQETYVFQPFPTYLWGILTMLTFLTSSILTILHRIFDDRRITFMDNLLRSFQAITMSGSTNKLFEYRPRNLAGIKVLWSLHALLVCTFYSAGFTSILTTPKYTKNINTIDDIVEYDVKYAHVTGNELELFRTSSDSRIKKYSSQVYNVKGLFEIAALVRENKYAFSTQILSRRYITETNRFDDYGKTHLKLLSDCLFVTPFVIIYGKNFTLANSFNNAIVQYIEFGLIYKWLESFERNFLFMRQFFTKVVAEEETSFQALKLERIQGIFYFLVLGLSVACVVFIGELFVCYMLCKSE